MQSGGLGARESRAEKNQRGSSQTRRCLLPELSRGKQFSFVIGEFLSHDPASLSQREKDAVRTPLRRMGTAEGFANLALFLSSDESAIS